MEGIVFYHITLTRQKFLLGFKNIEFISE